MINFTNNKKLNIKINILLAAFLEDEFYDIEVCLDEINKSLQENIGIWTYVHKTDDRYYHPVIYIKHNDKHTVIHFAADGAKSINEFINENETYYDVKNVIEAAIKNNDIDIEKLCESLNL